MGTSVFKNLKDEDEIQSVTNHKENTDLVRINWNIIGRIVTLLHNQGRLKKSEIATKANLGYDKCKRYLQWMEMMELVRKEMNENGFEVLFLTDKSVILYNEKFKDMTG